MGNWTDFLGAGKGIAKLIDVISKGTGRVSKSHFDKKDIDNEAYRIRELAKAKAESYKLLANTIKEVSDDKSDIIYSETEGIRIQSKQEVRPSQIIDALPENPQLLERSEMRQIYQHAKAQINVEAVTSVAAEQLSHEEQVSEDPVDEDWINSFFKIVEGVSNEEMQKLWGRILAGEVKSPNSFSLRTLERLRLLSQSEAKLISKVSNYKVDLFGHFDFIIKDVKNYKQFDIGHVDFLQLSEIGFLNTTTTSMDFNKLPNQPVVIGIGNKQLVVQNTNTSKLSLAVYSLTTFGIEIIKLLDLNTTEEFYDEVYQKFESAGFTVAKP